MKTLKNISALIIVVLSTTMSHAEVPDAAEVFKPVLQEFDSRNYPKRHCDDVLQQSWAKFSGSSGQYNAIEKKYMDGSGEASMCAITRGYVTYLLLGEVEKARAAGIVKKSGPDAAIKAAIASFWRIPDEKFNSFLPSVSCHVNTPRISFQNSFNNVINISCKSNLGPTVVDLNSMHVTIAGKDVWNGQNATYLGRSLAKALGQ